MVPFYVSGEVQNIISFSLKIQYLVSGLHQWLQTNKMLHIAITVAVYEV